MGRAALELIGRGGFGYSFDDLVSESRNEFAQAVKALKFVFIAHRIRVTDALRCYLQTCDE